MGIKSALFNSKTHFDVFSFKNAQYYKSLEIDFLFEMIIISRVFLRENDNTFEMIFFAKTRFKMIRKLLSFWGWQEG